MTLPPTNRNSAVSLQSPAANSSSFPAMLLSAEVTPVLSRRIGPAAIVIALVASLLPVDHAAHAEPARQRMADATASSVHPFAAFIAEASQRFGVPTSWIRAVMRVESVGDVHARSRKGAMGLMQIMPMTWADLRARYGFGANPYDPHDNILAGAAYLRELYDRYGAAGFLAAYNAGPARYEDHLASGRPLPAETRAYVTVLAPMIAGGSSDGAMIVAAAVRSWAIAPLFAAHDQSRPIDILPSSNAQRTRALTDRAVEDLTALVPQPNGLFVRRPARNPKP